MNLAEIRRRLPMYVKQESFVEYGYDTVEVAAVSMGIIFEDHKVYYKALCFHEDDEYARRDKFLSFFNYTKLLTIDDYYRETIYELHGFKNDIKRHKG